MTFLVGGNRIDIGNELTQILDAQESDPEGPIGERFRLVFATPQQAASAAIQPELLNVNPSIRNRLWRDLMSGFQDQLGVEYLATTNERDIKPNSRHFLDGLEFELVSHAHGRIALIIIGVRQPNVCRGRKLDDVTGPNRKCRR